MVVQYKHWSDMMRSTGTSRVAAGWIGLRKNYLEQNINGRGERLLNFFTTLSPPGQSLYVV